MYDALVVQVYNIQHYVLARALVRIETHYLSFSHLQQSPSDVFNDISRALIDRPKPINIAARRLAHRDGLCDTRCQRHCQRAIFQTILNLSFSKLTSPILTVAMPLNAKPLTPLYFYPLYVKSHQEEQRTISPLEKTMVQLRLVSLWDIQPSKSNKCLSIVKGFNNN